MTFFIVTLLPAVSHDDTFYDDFYRPHLTMALFIMTPLPAVFHDGTFCYDSSAGRIS